LNLILYNQDQGLLSKIILNRGKGINDVGDPDACELSPGFEYGIIGVQATPPLNIGIYVPDLCTAEDFKFIADSAEQFAAQMGLVGEGFVSFPNRELYSASTRDIIFFTFFSILALVFIGGIFVEYTPLFGKPDYIGIDEHEDAKRDKQLVKSKNKLGLFLLSFYPFLLQETLRRCSQLLRLKMIILLFLMG